MRKTLILLLILLVGGSASTFAQKRKEVKPIFEEASAREATPNVAVFVFPTICDLQMLGTDRETYGPYPYPLAKDLNSLSDLELTNVKTRALQQACILSGADLIIEPLYTSQVMENDTKTIYVTISGYPAKYINFRTLKPGDIDMIKALYPHGVNEIQRQNEGEIVTTAMEGAKK